MELHDKQIFRSMCYSKPMIIFLAIMSILLIRGTYGVYEKSQESIIERDRAQEKLAEIQIRQKEIQKNVTELQTNEGLEQVLRTKFNVAKAGEGVVLIIDQKNTIPNSTSTPKNTSNILWSSFRHLFNF